MSMLLELGNFYCDEATVNKTGMFTFTSTRECFPYDEVAFNDQLALVTSYNEGDENFNYAHVVSNSVGDPGGNRYYFIRNRLMAPGGKIIFILECDLLFTYKTQIYVTPCVCRRTGNYDSESNLVDTYIYDANLPVRAYRQVDEYACDWPNAGIADFSLDHNHSVIITAG